MKNLYHYPSPWCSLLLLIASSRRTVVVAAWTTSPPPWQASFYRPIPPDAAQELEDYFSSGKAIVDLHDLENVVLTSNKNNQGVIFPQAVMTEAELSGKPTYDSLEERVRHLEVQLAQLLKYGIPTEKSAGLTTTDSFSASTDAPLAVKDTAAAVNSVRTIQGIPYYCPSVTAVVDDTIAAATTTSAATDPATFREKRQDWEMRLKQDLENGMHMKGGENMRSRQVQSDAETKKKLLTSTIISSSSSEEEDDVSSSMLELDGRQSKLQKEMEACRLLTRQVLQQELQARGVDTKTLFDKSEFVARLAEARLQEAKVGLPQQQQQAEDCTSSKIVNEVEVVHEVEVVTDDTEPWNHHHGFPEGGIPTGGRHGFVQNGVVVNAGNGDGIPDMQNFGDGGGAFGGVNPFVLAKVRECLANPAAFAKYYSDPDLVAIIRELRQQMP